MNYLFLKHLHLTCVTLSGLGFLLRGVWMFRDSPMLRRRWVRIAPHAVDTALLASAVGLSLITYQYPGPVAWLNAKVVGLIVYVVCGAMALGRARTRASRIVFFFAAIAAFAYIVTVALARNPLGPWA